MHANHIHTKLALSIALLAALPLSALATAGNDVAGQWVGNSQLEGGGSVAKTTLSLGAPDGDNSALRLEGRSSCLLERGSYSGSGDSWSLTFKEARGGEACERLAKGTFTLRAGSKPRSLQFEAAYPGPDGSQNTRRGALNRYP